MIDRASALYAYVVIGSTSITQRFYISEKFIFFEIFHKKFIHKIFHFDKKKSVFKTVGVVEKRTTTVYF